jgi:hypothetical protein
MRRIAVVLGILLAAGCASAQNQLGQLPTFRQMCVLNSSGTCTLHDAVPIGDIEFVGADNFNNTYGIPTTLLSGTTTQEASFTGNSMKVYLWCKVTTSAGTESATLNGTPSFTGGFLVDFPNPLGYVCPNDASTGGATNGTNPETTTALTSSQNVDLAVCYFDNFHNGGDDIPSAADGWNHIGFANGSDARGFGFKYLGTNGSGNTCKFEIDSGADSNASWVFALFKTAAIAMVTTSLPSGALTKPYDATAQCAGGAGAYTFSASGLPSGLSINSSTGKITGTPTTGTTTPSISCTDGTHTATLNTAPLVVNSSVTTPSVLAFASVNPVNLGSASVGDCLLIGADIANGAPIWTPSDGLNTYSFLGVRYIHSGSAGTGVGGLAVWGATASSSGSVVITGPGVAQVGVRLSACQMYYDAVASSTGVVTGTATITGSAISTLAPDSFVWGFIEGWSSGTGWSAGTGFTADSHVGAMFGEDATESTVGSYTPTFAQTSNTDGRWYQWTLGLRPGTSGVVANSGGTRRGKGPF